MKKEQPNELSLPVALEEWHETEQSTIIDAFVYLTRDTESKGNMRSHREMTLDTSDNEALHYLMHRLNMTAFQVHILACALFHNQATGHACDTDDITGYMGCHPLELFSRKEDLATLVNLGYLEICESHFGVEQWAVREQAVSALSNNRAFDITSLRSADSAAFLTACAEAIRDGMRGDKDGEIEKQINWLFNLNQHLPIVQNIKRIASEDDLLFKPLVVAAALQSAEGMLSFDGGDFSMVLSSNDVRRVVRAMQKGTYPLVAQKIFEPLCNDGGLADADQWVISKDGWMELLSQNIEEVNIILSDREEWGRNLTPCAQIPERKLYFSGKTQEEVNRLRQLLQDDQYQQVVSRLKEKNMPTGLNILLYGTPGNR